MASTSTTTTTTQLLIKSIIFFTLFVVSINCFKFIDCGSKVGKFTKININCDTTKPQCILMKNTNVSISIDFEADEIVNSLTTVVHGKILGLWTPFPLPNSNACEDSGVNCPLDKGKTYEYHAEFEVLEQYPKLTLLVKWELKDENNKDIVCVVIPAKIQ